MINNAIHSALISILKSKRQKMNPAVRKRRAKPTRWLYPKTTEVHYGKAIRAWFRPMQDYVKKYLKEHSEAILHGDSENSVLRNDATTGRSFNVMVRSLDAWVGKYFSDLAVDGLGNSFPRTESPIYNGIRGIADTVFSFNDVQYKNSTKAALGIDFPVNEDWWPEARDQWAYNNYWYMQKYAREWVRKVDELTERAVTSGWSLSSLTKEIMASDKSILENKARFLARDQIGKLNGQITQHRMESTGLSMYVWSTSGDERVRGDPGGFFPDAEPSHYVMDEKLCRWDDPTVYSEDGGKTWINRPYNAVKLHPGEDYNCRCTALAYWNEIVDEVDDEISEYEEHGNFSPEENQEPKKKQEGGSHEVKLDKEKVAKALHKVEISIKDLNHEEGYIVGLDGKIIHHSIGGAHSVDSPSKLLKGNIFTHNHPTGGCSFSFDDIRSIIADDGYGVRAVTSDGKFVYFRKGEGEVKTEIVEAMAKARLGTCNLMIDAGGKASRKYGPGKATRKQILDIMNETMNKWLVDNAHKYGYIYMEGNI